MPEVYKNIIKTYGPGKICGVQGKGGYWADFGTFSKYLDLHKELLVNQRTDLVERPSPEVFIHRAGQSITISRSAKLRGFISIGNNCVIEDNVFLKDCVLWPGTRVPAGIHLQRSVLGKSFIFRENNKQANGESLKSKA